MPNAIDISNYTGTLEESEVAWLRENADMVIVRLSTEDNRNQRDIAAQQAGALADAGIPWQGYLWCYWDQDPYDHWQRATERLLPGWPGYHKLGIWLDCEDDAEPRSRPLEWVNSYASLLRSDGFVPGVYTGLWWMVRHSAAFAGDRGRYWRQYPLWFASYGILPGEIPQDVRPWGEWAMHQHTSVAHGPVLSSYDVSLIRNVP